MIEKYNLIEKKKLDNLFRKKTILVTGGTGSFGKAFVKRLITDFKSLNKIIVFSRDELKQEKLSFEKEIKENKKIRFILGDIRDLRSLNSAFQEVDFVIHAAALKQVPSTEYNPFEAVKTNILGAQNVINSCFENNVKKVIA